MATQEIRKATEKFDKKTLTGALKDVGADFSSSDNKDALIEKYEDAVIKVGVSNFVERLSDANVDVRINTQSRTNDSNQEALKVVVASGKDKKALTTAINDMGYGFHFHFLTNRH